MSDRRFQRAVNDWLEDGSDRTPRRAIDGVLLAVKTTPQQRVLRIPWRFQQMPALSRVTGIAAVALVVAVGAGGLIYFNSLGPSGPGGQATATPTLHPGIPGWTSYTSAVYGFTMAYPSDWRLVERASQKAPARPPREELSYADKFASPGKSEEEEIGLLVWQMPTPEGLYVGSDEGRLNTSFATLCDSLSYESCGVLIPPKKLCLGPLGLVESQQGCVRTLIGSIGHQGEESPHAFVVDPKTNVVTVFWIAREEGFPAAERYGGVTDLLMAIVSQFKVE